VVAAAGVILAALYLLWAYQRVFHGEPREADATMPDLRPVDLGVLAPFLVAVVFLGVYPKPVLDRIDPAIDRLITHVEANSDYERPEPAVVVLPADGEEPTSGAEGE
jgi:NADH-quinone oxidoreductase subunit M